jgi:hypothetical protein
LEEKVEEVEVRLREAQEALANFTSLIESLGWKRLLEIADGQLKNRMPAALSKTENLLELPGKEYEKGEIAGIDLFMRLPDIAIEGLKEDIKELEEKLGYVEGERTTAGTDGDDGSFVGDAP